MLLGRSGNYSARITPKLLLLGSLVDEPRIEREKQIGIPQSMN
ncbi:predicted protein [Botrytis cinerea T4]|uniref:Uncharacterized protein n=1 Tax=Botryotinia fuckeliana (strain T4) TaxID=999810 RepID=G2XRA3_BOTF4|nr:predicted protein [Botrytis cinerea T4]